MALVEDINIKVKDKNANAIGFEDIRQIRVPRTDGGYGLFTNLHSIRSYFLKPTGEENKYEVLALAQFVAGGLNNAKAMMVSLTNKEWDDSFSYALDNGVRQCSVILTPYNLNVGDIVDLSTL